MLLGMTPMAARADLVHRLSTSTQLTVDSAFTSGTRIGSTYTVSGNNIKDNGGSAGITFDGSGNTAIDGDLTVTGGDATIGAAGNTTATTISVVTNTGTNAGNPIPCAAKYFTSLPKTY